MKTRIINEFFQCDFDDSKIQLKIHNGFLDCEQYGAIRDLRDKVKGKKIEISGKSCCEAYALTGYFLTLYGAEEITGIDHAHETRLKIKLDQPVECMGKKWLKVHMEGLDDQIYEIVPSSNPDGKWSDEDLNFNTPVQFPSLEKKAHFTGKGSVWMYMLLGISAAYCGLREFYVRKPLFPYEILSKADGTFQRIATSTGKKHGKIIGILGDPNSGKSVFSKNIAACVRKIMPETYSSWLYDCDLASPTPDWYLDSNDPEAAAKERKRDKRKWSPELEKKATSDLQILRTNLDLVIADMPGGKKISEEILERIPTKKRAEMMKCCDAFIILCRKDQADEIFHNWETALKKYHLEDRIIAKIISADPQKSFAVTNTIWISQGLFTAQITGLDRKTSKRDSIPEMQNKFAEFIRHLCQ